MRNMQPGKGRARMSLFEKWCMYIQYPFVQRAMIVGIMIAFCSSLLGVTLVLKRFSLIGDGLSHVAFGIMCVAAILNISNDMLLILPATMLCAVVLISGGRQKKIQGDAAIAMMSTGALAIGYLLMNVFSSSANVSGDVCTTLFGSTSILTLTKTDVFMSAVLSAAVVLIYTMVHHKIFAVTFDEPFAQAIGLGTRNYHLVIASVSSIIIVLAMKRVGSLLISALIIFPALSSMRVCTSYRAVILSSSLLSIVCAALGISISVLAGTPVGSTIVAVHMAAFLLFAGVGKMRR